MPLVCLKWCVYPLLSPEKHHWFSGQRDVKEERWKWNKNRDVLFLYPSLPSYSYSPFYSKWQRTVAQRYPPWFPLRFAPGQQRPQSNRQGRWGRVSGCTRCWICLAVISSGKCPMTRNPEPAGTAQVFSAQPRSIPLCHSSPYWPSPRLFSSTFW